MNQTRQAFRNQDGTVHVKGSCVFSGEEYQTASFPQSAWDAYVNGEYAQKAFHMLSADDGEYAQKAFHMLSADDREFIISGISPKAFNEAFPDE